MLADNRSRLFLFVFLAALAVLAVACSPGTGQSIAGEAVDKSAITVVGQGEAFGEPDEANVQVGVEIFAETVEEATNENQAVLDKIMAALEGQGIAPEDIQTANYSLWAEQKYGDRGFEGISGYRVSNQVNVTVRDLNALGEVLAAVTEAGANSIQGVYFSVADPAALEAEARAAAMENARIRAEELAGLAGLELGEVKVVSEIIGGPPISPLGVGGGFAVEEAAVSKPGISPGQLNFQVQVQVTFSAQ
jgi:uncharacterized protein YggE